MTNEEHKDSCIKQQELSLKYSPEIDLTHIQKILISTINEHFEKFDECESLWIEDDSLTIMKIQSTFERLRRINEETRPNEYYPYYDNEIMLNNLKLGKVVQDMYFAYRIKTDYKKCPLCGSSIFPHSNAVSRRNSKITICKDCGQSEAMQDFVNVRE